MQEINLLQNKVKDRTLQYERSNRLVLTLFALVLISELAAVGLLYYLTSTTNRKVSEIAAQNHDIQTSMNSNQKDLALAKGLQAQLKNVNNLLRSRIYWSAFLDQISATTPAKVQFTGLNSSITDNKIHVEGMAQSYADVGRVLLSFSTSDKYKNAKLTSVAPSDGTGFGYHFSLDVEALRTVFTKPQ